MAGVYVDQKGAVGVILVDVFFGRCTAYADRLLSREYLLYVVAFGIFIGGKLGNALLAHELP